jgi:hypothetical protein
MDYEVRFTPLAESFMKAKSSLETAEATARTEIARLLDDGLEDPRELILHVFEVGGQELICQGREYGIIVDTCTYEEMDEPVNSGPLAGKKMLMPRGDSD